jgi:hypothetical protein
VQTSRQGEAAGKRSGSRSASAGCAGASRGMFSVQTHTWGYGGVCTHGLHGVCTGSARNFRGRNASTS